MARLPDGRDGKILQIKGRAIDFSLFPTVKGERRYGLQSKLFASNPWGIINQSIHEYCDASAKKQALAFIEQAEDFYKCSLSSSVVAAKPLLIYYCFLNLAKSYVLTKGNRTEYGAAYHGLEEKVHTNGQEFYDSFLKAHRSTNPIQPNVFDDFMSALTGAGLATEKNYELKHLGGQLLHGHRIWASAARRQERFIEIHKPKFMCNSSTKKLWLEFEIFADDLSRFDINRKTLLEESGLENSFREIKSKLLFNERRVLRFEQTATIGYTDRPSDYNGPHF